MIRHAMPVLVVFLLGGLAGCNPSDDGGDTGGGGGPAPVQRDRLPDSNNVNPSPQPDTFIDDEAERQEEREKRRIP